MGFDTFSITSKHPRNPTATETNTVTQFHFHKKGKTHRGATKEGVQQHRLPQSAADCVHTFHSYIISILWDKESTQADRASGV